MPARDILAAAQQLRFAMPVQVIGKKWRSRRADIARYFKDKTDN